MDSKGVSQVLQPGLILCPVAADYSCVLAHFLESLARSARFDLRPIFGQKELRGAQWLFGMVHPMIFQQNVVKIGTDRNLPRTA